MQTLTKLIKESLYMPNDVLMYELSLRMGQIYPDKYILETEDYYFDLKSFVEARQCQVRLLVDDAHPQLEAKWTSVAKGGSMIPRNSFQEVIWDGHRFKVLAVTYDTCTKRYYIVADEAAAAKAFFAQVCGFTSQVHGEILVYKNGRWIKDKALLEEIAGATLEGLILPKNLLETLLMDFEGFFASRDLYNRLGVAWKRGILMLGPPGNGKTHTIKAMINRLGKPCLYVRGFKSARATMHANIEIVFHRARQAAPCLLVMEDIDTMLDKTCLSFFLNEMDGFAANQGILTVATTNHPKKLDPAILDRPSRFDRKITFGAPATEERRRFLAKANEKREAELRLTDAELLEVAGKTEGFSFAYLKELCLSSTMVWMRDCRPGGMAEAMLSQAESLRTQFKAKAKKGKVKEEEDEDD